MCSLFLFITADIIVFCLNTRNYHGVCFMDFISFDEVVKKKATRRTGARSAVSSLATVTQVLYHEREKPSRITTIRLSEEAMNRARFKIGDRVDIAFSPDGNMWRLKSIDDENRGYKISGATKTAKVGVIRGTWYEGLPLIGGDIKIIRARMSSKDSKTNISIGEIILSFEEPVIQSVLEDA